MISTASQERLFGATALLSLATAAGSMWFVLPSYRRALENLGAQLSLPAQLAISASRVGVLLVAGWVAVVAAAYWKDRRGAPGVLSTVFGWCTLATATYQGLLLWVYLDLARLMARIQ